ncbi:MAG: hypothetical protein KatS3mg102_0299 [Planctomycetota bacterium]|nr:MAG: hypothetical protein KatS3mg102_0299 [Planctomycetota bacterium]
MVAGPDRGRGLAVRDQPITIGRGVQNIFRLRDGAVSRMQAVSPMQAAVRREGDRVVLIDEDSNNGTFVNNRRVTRQVLENCDVIGFGSTRILAVLPS